MFNDLRRYGSGDYDADLDLAIRASLEGSKDYNVHGYENRESSSSSSEAKLATKTFQDSQGSSSSSSSSSSNFKAVSADPASPISSASKVADRVLNVGSEKRVPLANITDKDSIADELHHACHHGYIYEVERLLKIDGIDINAVGEDGRAPILTALLSDREECAIALIDNGCDVTVLDEDTLNTPLHIAAMFGHLDVILKIYEIVGLDTPNCDLNTPLHFAISRGEEECASLLINLGADGTYINDEGCSPLHIACKYQTSEDLILALLKAGGDPNQPDKDGVTPFEQSIVLGNENITRILIENGACINEKNRSSIFLSLLRNFDKPLYKKIAGELLKEDNKIDLSKKDFEGNTPFYYSCKYGISALFDKCVKELQPKDLIEKNIYNETAFQVILDKNSWVSYPEHMDKILNFLLSECPKDFKDTIIRAVNSEKKHGPEDCSQENVKLLVEYAISKKTNPFDIALLLDDHILAQMMKEILPKEVFQEHLSELSTKFGSAADEFCNIQNNYNLIEQEHFRKSTKAKLDVILTVFDKLCALNPELVIPESLKTRLAEPKVESARGLLERCVETFISHYKVLADTKDNDKLAKRYNDDMTTLFIDIRRINGEDGDNIRSKVVKSLIEFTYKSTVDTTFTGADAVSLPEQVDKCFETKLHRKLAEFRKSLLFSTLPEEFNSSSLRAYLNNKLDVDLGALEESENDTSFEDFDNTDINIRGIEDGFVKRYNSYAIAKYVQDLCKTADFKDLFSSWISRNIEIPTEWDRAWNDLLENKGKLSALPELKEIQEKIVAALPLIIDNIDWEDKDNLELCKKEAFGECQKTSIDKDVLVELLEKCGVFKKSKIEQALPAQSVPPAATQEESDLMELC